MALYLWVSAHMAIASPGTDATSNLNIRESAPTLEEAAAKYLERLKVLEQRLLADPDDEAALNEILVLLRDGDSNAASLLGSIRIRAGRHKHFVDETVPALIRSLGHKSYHVRRAAAVALAGYGDDASKAVPIIAGFLKETNHDISIFAARALGEFGPAAKEAVPELIKALQVGPASPPRGPWIGEYAAQALGKIGPAARAAKTALTEAVKKSDGDYRVFAAAALAKIDPGNISAFEALAESLRSDDAPVRLKAVTALLELAHQSPEKVEAMLSQFQSDPDAEVRQYIEYALAVVKQQREPKPC